MKIKNMVKFIRSIVIILLIIGFSSLIITKSIFSHAEKEYKTIYVESGDTLWNIAKEESKTNNYYKNKDIRFIVDDITKENNLSSNFLMINQTLKIPSI